MNLWRKLKNRRRKSVKQGRRGRGKRMRRRSLGRVKKLQSLKRNRDKMELMGVVLVLMMMMLHIMNKRLERNLTKTFSARNQGVPKHLMVAKDSIPRKSQPMVLNLIKSLNLEVMINVIKNLRRNVKHKFSTRRVLDLVLRKVQEKTS